MNPSSGLLQNWRPPSLSPSEFLSVTFQDQSLVLSSKLRKLMQFSVMLTANDLAPKAIWVAASSGVHTYSDFLDAVDIKGKKANASNKVIALIHPPSQVTVSQSMSLV